jgi:hypothetical protein
MKTLNTSIDDQREQLIKESSGVLQLNIANGNPPLHFEDNQWDGYDYAFEMNRHGDIHTGVRIVNIDGAIQILTFTKYLLAGTYTITGDTTTDTIVTIIGNQLDQLQKGATA